MTASILVEAAFGPHPGSWPLPSARGPHELWLRAVAAAGQGRYAAARADLADLLRRSPRAAPASLAWSARGSFLRQLGWHGLARDADGRALALAGTDPQAAVDAMIGLAADGLGQGRLSAAGALLAGAAQAHHRADDPPPRLAIRLAWVRAELAMAAGEGAAAVTHARDAVGLADAAPHLVRHRVKSAVVLAAALCSSGNATASTVAADTALTAAETHGLMPLRWALACLLGEVGSARYSPAEVAGIRDDSARFLARHGGRLRSG